MGRHGEQVAVYASHEELGRWRVAASKAGMSLSTWIRERCERLDPREAVAEDWKHLPESKKPRKGYAPFKPASAAELTKE